MGEGGSYLNRREEREMTEIQRERDDGGRSGEVNEKAGPVTINLLALTRKIRVKYLHYVDKKIERTGNSTTTVCGTGSTTFFNVILGVSTSCSHVKKEKRKKGGGE